MQHSQVYSERAFNGFSLHFTVYAYLIASLMCVLLNIIFTPHLFEMFQNELLYAIFSASYKSVHCHFSVQNWFFFLPDCITLFQFMNTNFFSIFFWQLFNYFFPCSRNASMHNASRKITLCNIFTGFFLILKNKSLLLSYQRSF